MTHNYKIIFQYIDTEKEKDERLGEIEQSTGIIPRKGDLIEIPSLEHVYEVKKIIFSYTEENPQKVYVGVVKDD